MLLLFFSHLKNFIDKWWTRLLFTLHWQTLWQNCRISFPTPLYSESKVTLPLPGGGGHWPRKGIWGCAALKTPFSPLLQFTRVPFQAKESVHKTSFWENLEILVSTASMFAQILAHKPPNLEIFSSQAPRFENFQFTSPLFQRQISVRKPHMHFRNLGHTPLPEKKNTVPPCFHPVPLQRKVTFIDIFLFSLERGRDREFLTLNLPDFDPPEFLEWFASTKMWNA